MNAIEGGRRHRNYQTAERTTARGRYAWPLPSKCRVKNTVLCHMMGYPISSQVGPRRRHQGAEEQNNGKRADC
jgi:hypothetical protein